MHGSVCLLSRYLNNLLEGENLDELDISSASSADNIFSNQQSLSTGWKGTCALVNQYDNIYSDYSSDLNTLNTLLTTNHNNLLNHFSATNTLINNLYTVKYITSGRPSGSTASLLSADILIVKPLYSLPFLYAVFQTALPAKATKEKRPFPLLTLDLAFNDKSLFLDERKAPNVSSSSS